MSYVPYACSMLSILAYYIVAHSVHLIDLRPKLSLSIVIYIIGFYSRNLGINAFGVLHRMREGGAASLVPYHPVFWGEARAPSIPPPLNQLSYF